MSFRTLTVTYGLRWDAQWNPSPEANNTNLIDRLAGFTFPSGRQVDPTTIPDAGAQIAPRFGFGVGPVGHGEDGASAHMRASTTDARPL